MIDLTDKDLDKLKYIRLEFRGTSLTAYATDRYVLARAVYELDEPQIERTVYLDKGAVKFIRDNAKLTHQFYIKPDVVQTDNGNLWLLNDLSDKTPIDLESVIKKAQETPQATEAISMNLKLIERVNKLLTPAQANLTPARRNSDWTMRVGGFRDPIVFTEPSNTFIALAQPKLRRA
jgi:DNA polymerase III sliding clamp (beta) subunit (PCNA family)